MRRPHTRDQRPALATTQRHAVFMPSKAAAPAVAAPAAPAASAASTSPSEPNRRMLWSHELASFLTRLDSYNPSFPEAAAHYYIER